MNKAIEVLKKEMGDILDKQQKYMEDFENKFAQKVKDLSPYPCDVKVSVGSDYITFDVYVLTDGGETASFGQIHGYISRHAMNSMSSSGCVGSDVGDKKENTRRGAIINGELWKHCEELEELSKTYKLPYEDEYRELSFTAMQLERDEEIREENRQISEAINNLRTHKYMVTRRKARYGSQMINTWYRLEKITEKLIVLVNIYYNAEGIECNGGKTTLRKGEYINNYKDAQYVDEYNPHFGEQDNEQH
jgi:hypothetical protein